MDEIPRNRLIIYSLAVVAPAVTLLVRWPLGAVFGDRVMFVTFFPAVIIAAYFGGFLPGLLATGLSALAAKYFLVAPLNSFGVATLHDGVALTLFVLVGAMISGLSESLHRTRRRLLANERQRAEAELQETEDRFRQLAENINEKFWMSDVSGERLFYVSQGYEEIWGRARKSLPRSWDESIHPDDWDRAGAHLKQHKQGVFSDSEFRVVRPDGSVRW